MKRLIILATVLAAPAMADEPKDYWSLVLAIEPSAIIIKGAS